MESGGVKFPRDLLLLAMEARQVEDIYSFREKICRRAGSRFSNAIGANSKIVAGGEMQ